MNGDDPKFWYCGTCVLPSTRPNLVLRRDGSCDCSLKPGSHKTLRLVRDLEFADLVTQIRKYGAEYDCIIPVSGGKDSTWQVVTALQYGLRPLCVTWKSPARSVLGQKNLENLVSLGVDHVDFTVNPQVEKRFTRLAFSRLGSPAIPMHMAIHALALKTALRFSAPLVIYGENSAVEYGSQSDVAGGWKLTRDWLTRYGVTQGTTASDWVSETLSERDLSPYFWPNDDDLNAKDLRAVFLGYYFPWDPTKTYEVAAANGFVAAPEPTTGLYDFADIDDSFVIAVHHFMKWPKFGFTRTWDNIALEIRYGRMTREEGIAIIRNRGQEIPIQAIEEFCDYVEMPLAEFWQIVEKFRNPAIWSKTANDSWKIDNFLISDWNW